MTPPPPPPVPRPPPPLPPPLPPKEDDHNTFTANPAATLVIRDLITRTGPYARLPVLPTVQVHLCPNDPPTRQLLDLVPDLASAILVAADFVYSALYGTFLAPSAAAVGARSTAPSSPREEEEAFSFNYSQVCLNTASDASCRPHSRLDRHATTSSSTTAAPPLPRPPTSTSLPPAAAAAPPTCLLDPPASLLPPLPAPTSANHARKQLKTHIDFHLVPNMPGVADTANPSPTHAVLRISTQYLANVLTKSSGADAVREFYGVVVHELVHAYQGNGHGTAPWAWIEGVADWVRLRAGLPAKHWKRLADKQGTWEGGYEATGYFLDWVNATFAAQQGAQEAASGEEGGGGVGASGVVQEMNRKLASQPWGGEDMWVDETGRSAEELWDEYCDYFADSQADA